jgi:hypothetical protein
MQEKAAILMDELVTPMAAKWQQIGNSQESFSEQALDLTANVAVTENDTATSMAHPEGLEPPAY